MRCPKCGYDNKKDVIVCNSCGKLLPEHDLSVSSRKEQRPPEEQMPRLDFAQTDLHAVCTDPGLQARFRALSEEMARSGFRQFLDYTIPQFGLGNLTRAFFSAEVPAYGDVIYIEKGGRPQVYAEFVTPLDNGATLTTTNVSTPSWGMLRPPEHMVLVKAGIGVEELSAVHRKRLSIVYDSGAGPLPCTPEDYQGHFVRHYQESLTYAVTGRASGRGAAEGPGCAMLLAALAGLGAAALLLAR